eukprot:jgi/Mesen1/9941/ME000705S09080
MHQTSETSVLLRKITCIPRSLPEACPQVDFVHLSAGLEESQSRGVAQRNAALQYIEENQIAGVVYFADDDNLYSPQLFAEIRQVKRVGVWPVGFLWSKEQSWLSRDRQTEPFVERPLVRQVGGSRPQVYGWETFFPSSGKQQAPRRYNCDMAGFAFRSELLWQKKQDELSKRPQQPVRFVARSGYARSFPSCPLFTTSESDPGFLLQPPPAKASSCCSLFLL